MVAGRCDVSAVLHFGKYSTADVYDLFRLASVQVLLRSALFWCGMLCSLFSCGLLVRFYGLVCSVLGLVPVLLPSAVAFLCCAGSGDFPDICALFIPVGLRRFRFDLSPLVPVTFVLSSVSASGCDFFPLFSAGGYFSW